MKFQELKVWSIMHSKLNACQNFSVSKSEGFKRRNIKRGFHCIYTLNGRYQM